jgi:hypothetical protein
VRVGITCSNRSRISREAARVKVTNINWFAGMPCSNKYNTRRVSTVVFPLPGPANTAVGPIGAVTAFRWSSFNPLNNISIPDTCSNSRPPFLDVHAHFD